MRRMDSLSPDRIKGTTGRRPRPGHSPQLRGDDGDTAGLVWFAFCSGYLVLGCKVFVSHIRCFIRDIL
jgi:hypothetical protein